ncbi:efflux RND transporter permease subunit [Paracoccus mutanolyticus]|uniref:efflux RND transporter permease subunit n=1 Tax=Paracoccus mutanolyticus TaxID=1499308 RepID=UPI001CB9B7FA|nr:efflux RND transporter permease subunit [Paracoccus mutanolyticus]
MVPFSSFASVTWEQGPSQVVGYNGYPSIRIAGNAAPGYSSGAAMAEMERLAEQLPQGFGYEYRPVPRGASGNRDLCRRGPYGLPRRGLDGDDTLDSQCSAVVETKAAGAGADKDRAASITLAVQDGSARSASTTRTRAA